MVRVGRLAALLFLLSGAAQAQVPEELGFFGTIDGRWMWLGGDRMVDDNTGTASGKPAGNTNGPGGQLMIGYKFEKNWDWALTGDVQGLLTEITKFRNGLLKVDTNHQHFDLELGYSEGWWRIGAGLRGIHYKQAANYITPALSGFDQREIYGIGPKVGIGARWALSESWGLIAGADAALLAAAFADSSSTGGEAITGNTSTWRMVPQVGIEAGVSWRSQDLPRFSFATGVRVDSSFNTAMTTTPGGAGIWLEFGPFIRAAYNFSGPGRRGPPVAEVGATPPVGSDRREVHFNFGSDELTLIGGTVVRQAAADARRGRPVRLEVAGPSDGGDPALAERRRQTVREALQREGLDATQMAAVSMAE